MMVENVYTHSTVEVVERIIAVLDTAKDALGVKRVYYGRTMKIPDYPAICVEGGMKTRSLPRGSTHKFRLVPRAEIYVYFGTVDSAEVNFRANDLLSERVEDTLHEDFNLGGAVIFGYVTQVEPGISFRGDVMVKVSRLTWEPVSEQYF